MIEYSEKVKQALKEQKPIVALESTIISHGMPYPENVEMAKKVEKIIEAEGVTPATIAIIDGVIKVGLSDDELTTLAKSKDVIKTSKRDLAYVVSQKRMGATTVSGTMLVAEMAGIKVFATGGIGGVHRGAELSMDISRDLEELSKSKVAVVCAGIKSILDLEKTLEYLETKGVEVLGYQTNKLPAFYTQNSPFNVYYNMQDASSIAALMDTKWRLGLEGGLVIANPIPSEASIDETLINNAITEALQEAVSQGAKGKESTPFLLAHVKEITEGKSLEANLALVYHNACVASLISKAYQKLQ